MGIGDKLWTSADIKGLCEKNDVFGTIPKGDAIINILSNHREDLLKNDLRMIALYGNWGSGKTSLLNYINDRITQDNETKVIFFKAWEMESDDNLALSLLEQMIDVFYSEVKSEKLREKLKMIGNTVLRLAKNIVLNTSVSIPLTGISFDVANAGKDTIDEMKKIASKKSQYHQINKFKDEFNDLVNKIIEETTYKKIFIFVDDLDRCEPENVINLISNIKLFFSLSNELMYLCAIDKNAVSNALRIKYGNVIKSEEYLEKIFDIEFNMPTNMKLEKVVEKHFFLKANEMNLLVRFFNDIRFNNPRKILRLMNKYELIKLLYGENDKVFNENDFLYIIFLLYFLIIKEGFNVVFAGFFKSGEKIE